jgi:hypothetical protein
MVTKLKSARLPAHYFWPASRRLTPAVQSHCRGTFAISRMTGGFDQDEVSLGPRKPDLQG